MPVPKKKTSKMKKNMRRSHHKASITRAVSCPQCSEPKLHHRICPSCGYHKGKEVIAPKE